MQYDFVFSESENEKLTSALMGITAHPYSSYEDFMDEVYELVKDPRVPARYADFCKKYILRDLEVAPISMLGNCPIDSDLPLFDSSDPVGAKYASKKTFVTEGFLALHAALIGTEVIAHQSVNDGDFFHDIYPKASLYGSQSQKTLETLRFHRDFTNHFVCPDFVNTLTLRDTPENEVYSTFVINKEVIAAVNLQTLKILRQESFYTPYDDISTQESKVQLGRAKDHAVILEESGVKVFEGRTVGINEEAQAALDTFIAALHRNKISYTTKPGDCICFSNNHVIHGREVRTLRDVESLKQRWLMKTHNVHSLCSFEQYFLSDRYGVVNG